MESIRKFAKIQIDKIKKCSERLKQLNVNKVLITYCSRLVQTLSVIVVAKSVNEIQNTIPKVKYWIAQIRKIQQKDETFVPGINHPVTKGIYKIALAIVKIIIASATFVIQQITVSLVKSSEFSTNSDVSREDKGENIMAYYRRKIITDANVYYTARRINDSAISDLANKGKALCKKAILWCRQKATEYPRLSKVILTLTKLNVLLTTISGGVYISLASIKVKNQLIESKSIIRECLALVGDALGPAKVIFIGLTAIITSLLTLIAAGKIFAPLPDDYNDRGAERRYPNG